MSAQTSPIGTAGEYFVAAELALRGWTATVTLNGAAGIDVLAGKDGKDGTRTIQLQVKATQKSGDAEGASWPVGNISSPKKDEAWVVLAKLPRRESSVEPDEEGPAYWVIPRRILAGIIEIHERDFETRHGRKPTMNTLSAEWVDGFRGKWELLDGTIEDAFELISKWNLTNGAEIWAGLGLAEDPVPAT